VCHRNIGFKEEKRIEKEEDRLRGVVVLFLKVLPFLSCSLHTRTHTLSLSLSLSWLADTQTRAHTVASRSRCVGTDGSQGARALAHSLTRSLTRSLTHSRRRRAAHMSRESPKIRRCTSTARARGGGGIPRPPISIDRIYSVAVYFYVLSLSRSGLAQCVAVSSTRPCRRVVSSCRIVGDVPGRRSGATFRGDDGFLGRSLAVRGSRRGGGIVIG
jgi:hypothetical protein